MAHTPKTPKMKPKPKQRRRERTPNERDPKPLTLLDPSILIHGSNKRKAKKGKHQTQLSKSPRLFL